MRYVDGTDLAGLLEERAARARSGRSRSARPGRRCARRRPPARPRPPGRQAGQRPDRRSGRALLPLRLRPRPSGSAADSRLTATPLRRDHRLHRARADRTRATSTGGPTSTRSPASSTNASPARRRSAGRADGDPVRPQYRPRPPCTSADPTSPTRSTRSSRGPRERPGRALPHLRRAHRPAAGSARTQRP